MNLPFELIQLEVRDEYSMKGRPHHSTDYMYPVGSVVKLTEEQRDRMIVQSSMLTIQAVIEQDEYIF